MDKFYKATCNTLYMIIYVPNMFAVLLLIKKTKQKGSKGFWGRITYVIVQYS